MSLFNPEIRRNLWLEFSLHRLIAMPVVLGIIFFIAGNMGDGADADRHITAAALLLYFLLAKIWGGHKAAESVIEEVNEHTWDFQKLSALSPWNLTCGKLFGSTLYTWYGAVMAMAVYAASEDRFSSHEVMINVELLVLCGLIVHAAAILSSMVAIQNTQKANIKFRPLIYHAFGLMLGGIFSSPVLDSRFTHTPVMRTLTWYGQDYETAPFMTVAAALMLLWLVGGIYWQMRNQMKMRTGPWLWGGFLVFWSFFLAGIVNMSFSEHLTERIPPRSMVGFLITFAGLYFVLFQEAWSGVRYRRFFNAWKTGNYRDFFALCPAWVVSLPLCFIAALLVIGGSSVEVINAWVLSLLCFSVRDIALVHFFKFSPDSRRPLQASMFYLAVLYLLLPFLFTVLHLTGMVHLFIPFTFDISPTDPKNHADYLPVLSAIVQALVATVLAVGKWRRYWVRST